MPPARASAPDDRAARHRAALDRWPRLWGEDRDHGEPGEPSRPLSRRELAHHHGIEPAAGRRRRRPADTLEAAVAEGRPFLAVRLEEGGRRAVVLAALPPPSAEALAADEGLIVPALRGRGDRVPPALARAEEAVLVVVEVPGGRHRLTRRLTPATLARLRAA
ncbi:MAG: hypothetical protein QOD86_2652 [Miltoncostaeaceae bacterium]|nr:hypothetical protein [Miltoncostaeaceae bacterium]